MKKTMKEIKAENPQEKKRKRRDYVIIYRSQYLKIIDLPEKEFRAAIMEIFNRAFGEE